MTDKINVMTERADEAEYKTLLELDLKTGDVVESKTGSKYDVGTVGCDSCTLSGATGWILNGASIWRIVSRAAQSANPTKWRDMTPEQKGALLLASHEGKVIEIWEGNGWFEIAPIWVDWHAYRVKPEPVVEVVTMYGGYKKGTGWVFSSTHQSDATHLIKFSLINGEPNCESINKMEEL